MTTEGQPVTRAGRMFAADPYDTPNPARRRDYILAIEAEAHAAGLAQGRAEGLDASRLHVAIHGPDCPVADSCAPFYQLVAERYAALAGTPVDAGLDVERLARAMHRQGFGWSDIDVDDAARDIAREYAALAETPVEVGR